MHQFCRAFHGRFLNGKRQCNTRLPEKRFWTHLCRKRHSIKSCGSKISNIAALKSLDEYKFLVPSAKLIKKMDLHGFL